MDGIKKEGKMMITYSQINGIWWIHYHHGKSIVSKKMPVKLGFESVVL